MEQAQSACRVRPRRTASGAGQTSGPGSSRCRPDGRAASTPTASAGPVPRPAAVQRHSVRAQILDALRAALVGGRAAPGEVYSAPALAERFGVSATPVREAMQRLAVEGAVEVVPNRGFRVAERSARDLAELAEIRALFEIPSVLRLARRCRPAAGRAAPAGRGHRRRPRPRGDRAPVRRRDRAFHGRCSDSPATISWCGGRRPTPPGAVAPGRAVRPAAGRPPRGRLGAHGAPRRPDRPRPHGGPSSCASTSTASDCESRREPRVPGPRAVTSPPRPAAQSPRRSPGPAASRRGASQVGTPPRRRNSRPASARSRAAASGSGSASASEIAPGPCRPGSPAPPVSAATRRSRAAPRPARPPAGRARRGGAR